MNYPFWDVPFIGSGWVIGSIAIFHVMISHFAVGGGLYLALAERRARQIGSDAWLSILEKHSKFFLILTGVFGAASGAAIWFAIGLANPEGTSTLIHNFVFGWAIEWIFFLLELSAAAVYYYTWHRIPAKTHLALGWFYAVVSFLTLFIINGILTFMLTPSAAWLSAAGTGQETFYFFQAFFNPTFWPSLGLRLVICASLAGIYALITCGRLTPKENPAKAEMVQWSARWLVPSFILMPILFAWYLAMVPEVQRAFLSIGISSAAPGIFTQVTRSAILTTVSSATIVVAVYLFVWKKPEDFTLGAGLAILFLALIATGSTEHGREMLRKPFVIGQHMFSNGVRKSDVATFNQKGYLTASPWMKGIKIPSKEAGLIMFRGQCKSCHTDDGYRPMKKFMAGRDLPAIKNVLGVLHDYKEDSPYRRYMPPLVGKPSEIESLAIYLDSMVNGSAADAKK